MLRFSRWRLQAALTWRVGLTDPVVGALFDTARHGLAHLYPQTPVNLTDGKLWMASFTGVRPGEMMQQVLPVSRRVGHLGYQLSPNGHVYVIVRPMC